MYYDLVLQMKKELGQLDKWLEAATEHGKAKSFDPNVLIGFRLAPDQFPFSRQVQTACDTAKLAVHRLTGKPCDSHADTETTLAELQTRVRAIVTYLDGFTAKDFEGAAEKQITQPRWEGKWMTGHDYFVEHVVPNFFFHLTTSYAILRHNGVGVGKRDFLGTLTQHAPKG